MAHSRIIDALSALTVVIGVGAAAVPSQAQLETRGTFVADPSAHPLAIAVGDFNHDGIPDLAVVSDCCSQAGVSILLGRGDGTFQPGVLYATGDQPFSVATVDLDRDGNLDLAIANSLSTYITILLGNGDGTFRAGPQSPTVPEPAVFVTKGDFNGDGRPDLVSIGNNIISVFLGNGDGTFQDAVVTAPSFEITALGVGDFDGDGKLDVATSGSFGFGGSVNILLGNGDGTFQYGASYPGGSVPCMIVAADLNADRKLDLAIANSESNDISVLIGNGDGTFQPAVDYPNAFPVSLVLADMNGDDKPDLVAANLVYPSGASILLGNGDGTFQPGVFYRGGPETSYVAVGDFNSDEKQDLALANYNAVNIITLLNTGAVNFSPTTPLNFHIQPVGSNSAPLTVTLSNAGKVPLTISSMHVSGPFRITSNCAKHVPSEGRCTISATFSPKTRGPNTGSITINDSASSKPQVIELYGTGD